MKTISDLRIEGDARVSIHDMNKFEAVILGGRGDLDGWLECYNEEEVRLHIGKLLHLCVADLQYENQSLRAKISKMESQEPIAWTTQLALELGSSALGFDACRGNLWGEKGVPLYALPVSQPTPSVPDGWKLVPVEPTKEMLESTWADNAVMEADDHNGIRAALYRAMLAAAPEVES